jgi:hypothetical protein
LLILTVNKIPEKPDSKQALLFCITTESNALTKPPQAVACSVLLHISYVPYLMKNAIWKNSFD